MLTQSNLSGYLEPGIREFAFYPQHHKLGKTWGSSCNTVAVGITALEHL